MFLTDTQVSRLCKVFANNLSANVKLLKNQLSKIVQSRGLLGRLLGPLLKTGSPLIENVIKPLAKSVLIPLGLTTTASAVDTGIQTKLGLRTGTLIISNVGLEDTMKIVKSTEEFRLLIKSVCQRTN